MVEAYAEKRRYYIAKGSGRPDMHRAANEIVRHTVEGKVWPLRHHFGPLSRISELCATPRAPCGAPYLVPTLHGG